MESNVDTKKFFILYKPKDIVSGDFYYATSHKHPSSPVEKFYLCTADCTGHGVPGAFMSMLNISYLNESIIEKNISSPDQILNHIREEIITSLNPEGSEEESKDGMDCILCAFDFTNNKLEYAAANNSFYIARNNGLISCEADKMPVGKSPKEHEPFTLHTVQLQKGDVVYMLTDGLPDQFGGPKGKKFKYKQLEDLLLQNCALPMEEQKSKLNSAFEQWKGNLEQVDDVLLIGMRI
jgi:serine phosphatase RsbU (regulator of sigma subunit)